MPEAKGEKLAHITTSHGEYMTAVIVFLVARFLTVARGIFSKYR
jgi:hypothetical protein